MLTLVSKIVTVAEEKVIPENDEETDEVDDADLENLVYAFKHRCEYLLRNERHLVNSIERQAKYRSRLFNAHLHHLSTKHKTWASEAIERMTMLNERIENEIRDKEARKSAETPAESSQNIRNSPSLKPTLDQIVPDSRCIEVDNLGEVSPELIRKRRFKDGFTKVDPSQLELFCFTPVAELASTQNFRKRRKIINNSNIETFKAAFMEVPQGPWVEKPVHNQVSPDIVR